MSPESCYVPNRVPGGGKSNQAQHGNFCRAPKKLKTKGPESIYFCQPGIHRSPHRPSVDTIYFDNFILADTLEEVVKVVPGRAPQGSAKDFKPHTNASEDDYSPRYKVAIVTPYFENNARPALVGIPPSPWIVTGVTLQALIVHANGTPGFQVIGGPDWVSTDRWNVRLETEPVLLSSEQRAQVLLRAIEDRFQLKAHREIKVLPVYELAVSSTGSKLRPNPWLDARGPVIKYGIGSIHLRNTFLDTFAQRLSLYLARPVLNKTDMSGLFAFALDWVPGDSEIAVPGILGFPSANRMATKNTDAPSIFHAVQEQLGLRLTASHGPVEVVVIDHAEKPRAH